MNDTKIERGARVAIDFFNLQNPEWELFEAEREGNHLIAGARFSVRVGFYFRKPLQVIIGCGKLVRARRIPNDLELEGFDRHFIRIDPKDPDGCLYGAQTKYWHPRGMVRGTEYTGGMYTPHDTTILDLAAFVGRLEKRRRP